MAYVTPPTFNSGDVLDADDLNILGDDIEYLKGVADGVGFSGAKASRSSNQSIPDTTYTDVTFTAEVFDFGGWYSSGSTFTVPAGAVPAGFTTIVLDVVAIARFVANGAGSRQLAILKNGSTEDLFGLSALSGDTTSVILPAKFEAAAGDTIKIQVYQSSGDALNLDVAKLTVVRFAPVA